MEKQESYVTREEFDASIGGLSGVIGQINVIVTALASVLHQLQIVTPDLWKATVDEAEMEKCNEKVRMAAEKLRQISPFADVLRGFQGPPQ